MHARVCIICTCACVAPHCGCVWCGRRGDAEIMRRIFGCGWCYGAGACCGVQCMCTGPIAIQVDVITRRKGVCTYAQVRCRYWAYNSGCRVQDAGARRVSNAEGIRRMIRKHDCALPAQYTKHSNAPGHSLCYNSPVVECFGQ